MSFGHFGANGWGMETHDPDIDRRSTSLLGRIRRFFDRDEQADWHWYGWWEEQSRRRSDQPHRPWPGEW